MITLDRKGDMTTAFSYIIDDETVRVLCYNIIKDTVDKLGR